MADQPVIPMYGSGEPTAAPVKQGTAPKVIPMYETPKKAPAKAPAKTPAATTPATTTSATKAKAPSDLQNIANGVLRTLFPAVELARTALTTNAPESTKSGPIASAGQGVLNVLGAQLAGVTGVLDATLKDQQQRKTAYAAQTKGMTPAQIADQIAKGKVGFYGKTSYAPGSTNNPIAPIAEGIKNATAFTRGEKTITSYDVLTKRLGLPSATVKSTWLNYDGSLSTIDLPNPGTSAAALLSDIALDPLTYETAGISAVAKVLKAVGEIAPAAARAAELTRSGEIAATAGKKLADKYTEVVPQEIRNEFKPKSAQIPAPLKKTGAPAINERIAQAEAKISEKGTYRTVQQSEPAQAQQVIASLLEAGKTAFTSSLEAANAAKWANDYMKADRVSFLKLGQKWTKPIEIDNAGVATHIVQTKDGYNILSGNRDQILGTASTLKEAAVLANKIKTAGISGAGYKAATLQSVQSGLKAAPTPPTVTTGEAVAMTKNAAVIERAGNDSADKIKSTIAESIASSPEGAAIKNNLVNLNKEVRSIVGTRSGVQDIRQSAADLRALVENQPKGYAQVSKAFGKPIADKIRTAGLFTKFDEAKFVDIASLLATRTSQVKYAAVEDMIAGLRSGDKISDAALKRVFGAIDPETRNVLKIENAAAKPTAEYIKDVLIGDTGTTIAQIDARLNNASDIVSAIKGTGIDSAATVSSIIDISKAASATAEVSPEAAAIKNAVENLGIPQTRQAAAERLMAVAGSREENIAFEAMAGANKTHNIRLDAIQSAEDFERGYTDMGYLADMSSTARYSDGSMASVANRFDQNWEKDVVSSTVAITRHSAVEHAKAVARDRKKIIFNPLDPQTAVKDPRGAELFVEEQYRSVENSTQIASDYLTAASAHMVNAKLRDDINTLEAYYKAMNDGRVADRASASKPHFVYVTNGDVFTAFRKTEDGAALLKEAFFPATVGEDYKRNSFLWMNLSDATRRIMEMHSTGEAIDLAEIEYRLLKRHSAPNAPTAEFAAKMPELAAKIAKTLEDPRVMEFLQKVHLEKSKGIIEDFAQRAKNISVSLMDSVRETWIANIADGAVSETARIAQVQAALNRFTFAAEMFKFDGGPIAENLFRTSAMFMFSGGKAAAEGKEAIALLKGEAFADFHEALVTYSASEKAAESTKFAEIAGIKVTKAQKQAAQNRLTSAEIQYETHAKNLSQVIDDPEGFKLWDKERAARAKRLDKARIDAYAKGLQTRHYDGTTWVNSELYNREDVIQLANQNGKLIIQGQARPDAIADSKPVTMVELKTKASPEELAAIQKDINATQREIANTNIDNALDEVLVAQKNGAFNFPQLDSVEQAYRALDETVASSLIKNTQIADIYAVNGSYEKQIGKLTDRQINERFFPNRNPETKVTTIDRIELRKKQFGEKWYGPSNRRDVVQIINSNEITSMTVSARFGDYLHAVRNKWADIDQASFDRALSHIKNGTTPSRRNPTIAELHGDIKRATDLIFGSRENNAFVKNGISMDMLRQAMGRLGLNEEMGFSFMKGAGPNKAFDFMQKLPMGGAPKGYVKGTVEYEHWLSQVKAFKAANMDPFMAFSKIMQAVQMVKLEKGIMEEFAARFSHLNFEGARTAQEAIAKGFVKPSFIGDEKNLGQYLPDENKGGLFRPEDLDQLGSMMREMHAMYSSNNPAWARKVIEVGSFFKASQTLFRAGHHIGNGWGDTSAAWVAGVRNPEHWSLGYSMAKEHGLAHLNADYQRFAMKNGQDILQNKWDQIFHANQGKYKTMVGAENGEKTIAVVVYKNGKPTRVNFTQSDMIDMFEKYGIMITNIYAEDIQSLTDSLEANPADVIRNTKRKQIAAGMREGIRKIEKPVGDFTAWYGNITRAAHAMKVIHSKSWGSLEDALTAAADQVNLYHPTIHSLASSERRYARMAVTYYTWLRMAHMATIDMLKSHAGAFMIAPKLNYNLARGMGYQPESIGTPWDNKDITTPSYLRKSVYGPNVGDPNNPGIVKIPFMGLQVLDQWSLYWDPSLRSDENAVQNVSRLGLDVGKQFNLVGKPLVELLWHVDPDTGKTSQIDDARSLGDSILSNFGFMNLLKGIPAPEIPQLKGSSFFQHGYVYTPKKNEPSPTKLGVTPQERNLGVLGWFGGPLKATPATSPANEKIGIQEYRQQLKNEFKSQTELQDWLKQYGKK